MEIREIEKVIDEGHKDHKILKLPKMQAIYNTLASFEDMCSLKCMASVFNPIRIKEIVDQMDALNMALTWINQSCPEETCNDFEVNISEKQYEECSDFLNQYAYPYSVICSGYIAYSRKRFDATVDKNCVTYNLNSKQNDSVWNDILREKDNNSCHDLFAMVNLSNLSKACKELQTKINIKNGVICYSLTEEVVAPFREVAQAQWDITKTLPDTWEFDLFTMYEYKKFWVALATLSYIHICSCFSLKNALERLKNGIIVQTKRRILDYICFETGLKESKVEKMLNYITYHPNTTNNDIMYTPLIETSDNRLLIAPFLFVGSRPERNLLAIVSAKHDDIKYFKEVNNLEELMVSELEIIINSKDIVKHRHLRADLPDIDFAVFDSASNAALICETKWFAAADSTKEVYAKEDEITHGCEQVEKIVGYALSNRKHFFKQVFNINDGESIDLFCCVVAKHNIRTQNKYVPVIDLKRIKELLVSYPLSEMFNIIRNYEYMRPMPNGVTIRYQTIKYLDYIFRIPSLCFEDTSNKLSI